MRRTTTNVTGDAAVAVTIASNGRAVGFKTSIVSKTIIWIIVLAGLAHFILLLGVNNG